MTRRARRIDANHGEIVTALRSRLWRVGCSLAGLGTACRIFWLGLGASTIYGEIKDGENRPAVAR